MSLGPPPSVVARVTFLGGARSVAFLSPGVPASSVHRDPGLAQCSCQSMHERFETIFSHPSSLAFLSLFLVFFLSFTPFFGDACYPAISSGLFFPRSSLFPLFRFLPLFNLPFSLNNAFLPIYLSLPSFPIFAFPLIPSFPSLSSYLSLPSIPLPPLLFSIRLFSPSLYSSLSPIFTPIPLPLPFLPPLLFPIRHFSPSLSPPSHLRRYVVLTQSTRSC